MLNERFSHVASLSRFLAEADHVDVKSSEGKGSVREFVAGMLSYQPGWMRVLWRVRVWLLKSLGQGEQQIPEKSRFTKDSLPVIPGEKADFFEILEFDDKKFWVATGKEKHLEGVLAVVAEPVSAQSDIKRFYVITIVIYRNFAGRLYFNIIRPFHHLVVKFSMKSALSG